MQCYCSLRTVQDLLIDGKTPYERRFGQPFKGPIIPFGYWLSITLSLRKTSQESINLERKSYLDCSSDTHYTRGEFGTVTYWWQTLRSWRRWTHQKSTQKDSMRKRWYFPQKKTNLFSNRRWTNQNPWRRSGHENIHLDTAATNSRRKSSWFSWRIRRVSTNTSRLVSGCRWSHERFLVYVRKLHISPSHWTQSQTLLAERRIIPYSTEVHWRIQNYSYEFGCQARETHRWLLEYRWVKRLVWSMDRVHTIYSIGRKSSWRIYVVRGEIDEKTAYIQARSSMARTLEINGKARQAEGEAKVV